VDGTAGIGVHTQLQNTAKHFWQVRHQKVGWCGQIDQSQITGQFGVHAMAQGVIGQGQSWCKWLESQCSQEKASTGGNKDHNQSMSFVGVKGDKNTESNHNNEPKKKEKQKVETPRSKEKDNNLEKSRIVDKKDKSANDEKLYKELEKSKNVIADLKDQLI